jgi:hypothetical protein
LILQRIRQREAQPSLLASIVAFIGVHPLSRLVEFETGVVMGAIVTDSARQVSELLFRLFENQMEYGLEQSKRGHLLLKETVTVQANVA